MSPSPEPRPRPSPAVGIRERNRREITKEILAAAHTHLASHGAEGLSLRAITRELGMASSAIYRYFASRDELLTALIIEAYSNLAEDVRSADATIKDRDNHVQRWLAIAHGIRAWAKAYPHQWALIYGTPISGYAAPDDTIAAATSVTEPMIRLLADQAKLQHPSTADPVTPEDRHGGFNQPTSTLDPALAEIFDDLKAPMSAFRLTVGLGAWAQVVGLVSLELFGHLENVVQRRDEHFAFHAAAMAERLKLHEPS